MVIGLRVAEFNLLSYKTLTKLDDRKAKMMAWGNLLKNPEERGEFTLIESLKYHVTKNDEPISVMKLITSRNMADLQELVHKLDINS